MRNAVISLFLIFFIFKCHSVDLYVSTKGSDSNTGTSLIQAYKTFTKAVQFSNSDLNILVEEGTYIDTEVMIKNMTNVKITSISGASKTTLYKLSSSQTIDERNIFNVEHSKYITISGFTSHGIVRMTSFGSLIKVKSSSNITLSDMVLESNEAKLGSAMAIIFSDDIILDKLTVQNNIAIRQDTTLQRSFHRNKLSVFRFNNTFMASNTPFFNADDSLVTGRGTIYIEKAKNIKVTNSIFRNNIAKFGGCFYLSSPSYGLTSLFVENSYFENNNVSAQGSVLYGDDYSVFQFSDSAFISNKCTDWKCKLLYSSNWENDNYQDTFFELPPMHFSRTTNDVILLTLQSISISIVGLIILDGLLLGLFILFFRFIGFGKAAYEKGSKDEDDTEKVNEMKEHSTKENVEVEVDVKHVKSEEVLETTPEENNSPTEEVKEQTKEPSKETESKIQSLFIEEEEELDEELQMQKEIKQREMVEKLNNEIEDNDDYMPEEEQESTEETNNNDVAITKKKSYLKSSFDSFRLRQQEQDAYYDTGFLSNTLGWLFSTIGIAYPKSVPKLWRLFHNVLIFALLVVASIIFILINSTSPKFTYDGMATIEVIASTIEYNLVPITPSICYCFLIIFCTFTTGIILKKRTVFQNFLIVGLTFLIVTCIIIGTTIFNLSDNYGKGLSNIPASVVARKLSSVLYWNLITVGSFYSVLITTLHQIHLFQIISAFFAQMDKDIMTHKFHFISHTAKLFKFQHLLIYQQNLANIFLTPTCFVCLGSAALGVIFQLFGFSTRFAFDPIGRYLYIAAFGGISVFLMMSYAFITFIFSFKYSTTIQQSIEKMRDQIELHENLTQQTKTIEQLRRFESFTKTKLFSFKLAGVIELTFGSILGKATLVTIVVTFANNVFPLLIDSYYSQ
eukprot:gene1735-504_t